MAQKINCLAMFAICLVMLNQSLYASKTAKELLSQSISFFNKGQYKKALNHIAVLDVRNAFDNSDDMKLAFKIRAIAYEQTGDQKRARETIKELFYLDPDYQFDPFDTPKSVVALAEQEKALINQKNQYLAEIKNEAQLEKYPIKNEVNEDALIKTWPPTKIPHQATAFFPMGLNHYYLQSPVKGGVYFMLQTLGLATNIAAFWWKQSYLNDFGVSRLKDRNLQGRFETAQMIQYVGLSTLVVSYVVSVIDALIRFQDRPSQKRSSDEITS